MMERQILVLETVTPEKAAKWLAQNARNRSISSPLVQRYTKDMLNREWKINGETIKIGRDGQLLDNQHRLLACIAAKMNFKTYVVYGVDPETFDTIDTGRKRSGGDILSILGCVNPRNLAAAYRWVRQIDAGSIDKTQHPLSPHEVHQAWADDPSLEIHLRAIQPVKQMMSTALAAALHQKFSQLDCEEANRFFSDLASGAGLSIRDPVLLLRNWLLAQRAATYKGKHPIEEVAAKCIRAWNHRRAGREIRTLKGLVRTSGEAPKFPKIE